MKITKNKILKSFGAKAVITTPDDTQLAIINGFTKRVFTADELYVSQIRLANNAIDRDGERFSDETLQGFIDSAVKKTWLLDHDKKVRSAIGKIFAVEKESMTIEDAKKIDENIELPAGMKEVIFFSPWIYIPKKGISDQDLIKIEAGIYDFASIGFSADKLAPVRDDEENILYWEYKGAGKTNEGSYVYLGAQYGAASKTADDDKFKHEKQGGIEKMKDLIKKFKEIFQKTLSEDGYIQEIVDFVKGLKDEITAKETTISDHEKKIKELGPMAEIGQKVKDKLVEDAVHSSTLLGEIDNTDDAKKKETDYLKGCSFDRLQKTHDSLLFRAKEKFPTDPAFQSKDNEDRDKTKSPAGSSGGESPLIKNAKERAGITDK
ncbi:MAG: hypothetical protein Q7U10_08760 [Thermodesulfovibrionia bacterium]|nr:hypothetical protein [Thermodesulfovibrionia bacterium]